MNAPSFLVLSALAMYKGRSLERINRTIDGEKYRYELFDANHSSSSTLCKTLHEVWSEIMPEIH